MIVYVGTTTGQGRAEGIGVFRMDDGTGALTHLQTVQAANPTFLWIHPSGRYLYAATRGSVGGADGDTPRSFIEAFAIDPSQKTLTAINRQSSGGQSPAYVSVHPTGRCVFAANYTSGHVASLPVKADGSLGEAATVILHEGRSVDARRQEGPHAHFIQADPTGERVFACDLGCDKVFIYRVDPDKATLTPNEVPYGQLSSGAGPRHLSFHPNGRLIFVINEMDSTLSSFAYDASRGAMEIHDTRSTVPEGYAERTHTAQVVTHPNGRFVYGSNRGHDSIAIFGIDQERGKLTPLGHEPTQGKVPRNFNIDPTGTL
ncbi:MAG TPA: lactonase family protein, partial [Chloroflexota bacterium]|nr:lactonase family protein [Chloroflexota bacterium]